MTDQTHAVPFAVGDPVRLKTPFSPTIMVLLNELNCTLNSKGNLSGTIAEVDTDNLQVEFVVDEELAMTISPSFLEHDPDRMN